MRPDGSIDPPEARVFRGIGDWTSRNEEAIRATDRAPMEYIPYYSTVRDKTLYLHLFVWPGPELVFAGLRSRVKSARLLASGKRLRFEQEKDGLFIHGLPAEPPDSPATVIAIECASPPRQVLPLNLVRRPGWAARS